MNRDRVVQSIFVQLEKSRFWPYEATCTHENVLNKYISNVSNMKYWLENAQQNRSIV